MSVTIKPTSSPTGSDLGPDDWNSWRKHLDSRQEPTRLADLYSFSADSPLTWTLPENLEATLVPALVTHWKPTFSDPGSPTKRKKKKKKKAAAKIARDLSWVDELETWLTSVAKSKPSSCFAYECIAWSHLLPQLAHELPAAPWTELLDTLIEVAEGAQQLSALEDALPQALLAGELGLTLSYLFPELESCQKLEKPSATALSTGILELLDGEGLPHVSDLPVFRALIASWTRCDLMADALDSNFLSEKAREQFEWAIRQAIYLTRNDLGQLFASTSGDKSWPICCEGALKMAGDEVDWYLASQSILKAKQKSKHRDKYEHLESKDLPDPAIHSTWSEFTVMRNHWRKTANQLAIGHEKAIMATELLQRGTPLLQGDWVTSLTIDGTPVTLDDEWDVTCWYSDDDGDYLELENNLGDHGRLQRQILLGRDDSFLFQADVILRDQSAKIEYQTSLPLRPEVRFQAADKTHEGVLTSDTHQALVLPLACPEWRTEPSPGCLQQVDATLQYQLEVNARNLYAPLFIDLSRSGSEKAYTWRRLTIAELLEIQSPEVAVGYRIQVGSRQWCLYRSLDPPANRTFFGQNLTSEFIFGRFTRDGELREILEIE